MPKHSQATVGASNTLLANTGRVYVPINSDGALSEEKGSKSYARSSITVTWNDGSARTATESGLGVLTGDATGTVDYALGIIRISPNVLPPAVRCSPWPPTLPPPPLPPPLPWPGAAWVPPTSPRAASALTWT
ncbi:MAG: hypothetical protein IPN53_15340 [Comamonadaceae bacterium]|nr:hypothetical protein [Comamonadaceae bacterium]